METPCVLVLSLMDGHDQTPGSYPMISVHWFFQAVFYLLLLIGANKIFIMSWKCLCSVTVLSSKSWKIMFVTREKSFDLGIAGICREKIWSLKKYKALTLHNISLCCFIWSVLLLQLAHYDSLLFFHLHVK